VLDHRVVLKMITSIFSTTSLEYVAANLQLIKRRGGRRRRREGERRHGGGGGGGGVLWHRGHRRAAADQGDQEPVQIVINDIDSACYL
ncbi:Os03g0847900, partial [Oryza sativa Japonica Group]